MQLERTNAWKIFIARKAARLFFCVLYSVTLPNISVLGQAGTAVQLPGLALETLKDQIRNKIPDSFVADEINRLGVQFAVTRNVLKELGSGPVTSALLNSMLGSGDLAITIVPASEGCTIAIQSNSGRQEVKTDPAGRALFEKLDPDEYAIGLLKSGSCLRQHAADSMRTETIGEPTLPTRPGSPRPLPVKNVRLALEPDQRLDLRTNGVTDATVSEQYSAQFIATGGIEPYAFSIVSGEVPPGLSFSPETGIFQGIPTQAGVYPLTIQVSDAEVNLSTPPQMQVRLLVNAAQKGEVVWHRTTSASRIIVIQGSYSNGGRLEGQLPAGSIDLQISPEKDIQIINQPTEALAWSLVLFSRAQMPPEAITIRWTRKLPQ